ncbi:MAG: AMP-binding protein [Candidatus Azobacteroides sp.]|nr:AMP-binding protein [Candidatus Azobacteroides sp.]
MRYTENFIKLYEQSLRDNFELPALSDYGTDVSFTYKELAIEIEKIHDLFTEQGIHPGDSIALVGKNSAYWGVIFLATVTYGAVIVPILQDFHPHDIQHIVNHSDSVLFFASDSSLKDLDESQMPALKMIYSFSGKQLNNRKESENLSARLTDQFNKKYPNGFNREMINYTEFPNKNVAILNYTSGTSGFSKGVLITGDNLIGNIIYAQRTMPLEKGNTMLSLLPLAHAYGCTFEFLFPLSKGCHITLLGKTPAPNVLMKAFEEIKPNLIISVPLILEKIYKNTIVPVINKPLIKIALKLPGLNAAIYSSVRKKLIHAFGGKFNQIVIGGAPLNKDVEEFFLKIGFPVSVGYGMTECAPLISFSLYSDYTPLSCGKVLPNLEVRIDSPDPYLIAGEIQVAGQNVMQGYYKNGEETQHAFTVDGWLKTGDLGTMDKNNDIFIRGRSKCMILSSSGQNIYPEEIEAKLNNFPYVIESLVISKNNRLIALVYPDYDAIRAAGLSTGEDLKKVMLENKEALNSMVASFEKIAEIQLCENEFEKTPKRSIKRYLYTD